jgi:hypothetical protein
MMSNAPSEYLSRVTENKLERKLCSSGAVHIEGPKWCGKMCTAMRYSKSSFFTADVVEGRQNKLFAQTNPGLFKSSIFAFSGVFAPLSKTIIVSLDKSR